MLVGENAWDRLCGVSKCAWVRCVACARRAPEGAAGGLRAGASPAKRGSERRRKGAKRSVDNSSGAARVIHRAKDFGPLSGEKFELLIEGGGGGKESDSH